MQNSDLTSKKSNATAFILCSLLGIFGIHRIYAKKYFTGLFQLLTFGGIIIWWFIDIILILQENFTDNKGRFLKWNPSNQEGFASIKIRFAAHIIDSFIPSTASFTFSYICLSQLSLLDNLQQLYLISGLKEIFTLIITIIYYTYLSASNKQATLGKEIVGIIVVNKDNKKLSFINSFGRCLAYFFSYATLGIGFIMIAFTKKHRGLHDYIAKTYVIYKPR